MDVPDEGCGARVEGAQEGALVRDILSREGHRQQVELPLRQTARSDGSLNGFLIGVIRHHHIHTTAITTPARNA